MEPNQSSKNNVESLPPELNFQPASTLPPSTPKRPGSGKKLWIIVAGVMLVILLGVGALVWVNQPEEIVETEESRAVASALQNYPIVYSEAGLPQYPDGSVSSQVRPDATIEDGPIVVLVGTNDSAENIVTFYDQQLIGLGWQKESEDLFENGNIGLVYTKEGQQIGILVGANTDQENGLETTNFALVAWAQEGQLNL